MRRTPAISAPLGTLLLRTECVASSRIEEIDAGIEDYARALCRVAANRQQRPWSETTAATDRSC